MKTKRGDSSQLQAHLAFPSASPSEARPTRPMGAETRSLTKGVQSSLYAILYKRVILPDDGIFSATLFPKSLI